MRLPLRAVALCAVTCAVTCAVSAATGPQVSTLSGDVSGAVLQSFLGRSFFSFKGIPYAEPPVGGLRLRAPQPHRGWQGVRAATDHGSRCLQFAMFSSPRVLQGSEDCLFLNVYTPSLPDGDSHPQLPVMVWIHGGGFVTGSGDSDFYGPDYFMDEEVVLVTFNYRLGPFGFFTTADANAPGNYGLHDQVLALEWVQANIAAFGGDPDSVTIFGGSAGGASVGLHVLSPRSRGLFAKAISQSGASLCNFGAGGEPQGENAKRHAELLDCPVGSSREIVGCMRQKPAEEVFDALGTLLDDSTSVLSDLLYKPRVDADSQMPFLPLNPHEALRSGVFNLVPWVNGLTQDEGAFFVFLLSRKPWGMEAYRSRDWNRWASSLLDIEKVTSQPAAVAEAIHHYYFGDAECGNETLPALCDLFSDRWFTNCVVREVSLAAAHTPVYMYVFDHTGPGRQSLLKALAKLAGGDESAGELGVSHGDDMLYLFRLAFASPVDRDSAEYKMVRVMVSLWTGFARRGYPSTDVVQMPSWPIYTASLEEYMRLNMAPSVGRAAFSDRRQFWQQLDISENWREPPTVAMHDEL